MGKVSKLILENYIFLKAKEQVICLQVGYMIDKISIADIKSEPVAILSHYNVFSSIFGLPVSLKTHRRSEI